MPFEFRFPDVGEGITEGEIVRWKVKEGDVVKQDQELADIETDKAIVQLPSPRPGKILKIHVKEGTVVKVGQVLVTIDDGSPAAQTHPEEKKSYGIVGEISDKS